MTTPSTTARCASPATAQRITRPRPVRLRAGGIGVSLRSGATGAASAPMAGYPKIYNIEMDPHEDLNVGGLFGWTGGPALMEVERYLETIKKYPNPPAPNITQFKNHGG